MGPSTAPIRDVTVPCSKFTSKKEIKNFTWCESKKSHEIMNYKAHKSISRDEKTKLDHSEISQRCFTVSNVLLPTPHKMEPFPFCWNNVASTFTMDSQSMEIMMTSGFGAQILKLLWI